MKRGLYETLGVAEDADEADVKRAYRRRAVETHPDAGGDPAEFRRVQEAYEVLSDPERRARYDETGLVDDPEKARETARRMAVEVLVAMVEGAPEHVDYAAAARESVEAESERLLAEAEKLTRKAEKCRRAAGRLRLMDGSPAPAAVALGRLADEADDKADALAGRDAVLRMALEELGKVTCAPPDVGTPEHYLGALLAQWGA